MRRSINKTEYESYCFDILLSMEDQSLYKFNHFKMTKEEVLEIKFLEPEEDLKVDKVLIYIKFPPSSDITLGEMVTLNAKLKMQYNTTIQGGDPCFEPNVTEHDVFVLKKISR